mmetsp:Transcript_23342/g.38027  ORF Transcript_23342/g.38027 Transcript_23342/m.38027 type:complete len:114 (-) Transcript_23342:30-371(-)
MQAPPTAMAESSESGRSRPKFRRPSTSTDEDISTWEHQLLAAFGDKTRRPSESSMESQYSRERSHDQLSRMSVPASFSGFRFLSIQKRHFKIFGANYTEKEDREMCLSCNNSF